jgi:hypothetical protein
MELVPLLCERARRWSSLRVDGELSELECRLLDVLKAAQSAEQAARTQPPPT